MVLRVSKDGDKETECQAQTDRLKDIERQIK